MKEYEKLANQYTDMQPIELSIFEANWICDAYIAGFLKAREMALELAKKAHDSPLSQDVPGYQMLAKILGSMIAEMGDRPKI